MIQQSGSTAEAIHEVPKKSSFCRRFARCIAELEPHGTGRSTSLKNNASFPRKRGNPVMSEGRRIASFSKSDSEGASRFVLANGAV